MPDPVKKPLVTDATAYDAWFAKYEQVYNLPPNSLKAISWVESRYKQDAVAPQYNAKGETNGGHGLMQFLKSTAKQYGIDPFNPEASIRAAGEYMRNAITATGGDIQKAFQSYNMGIQGAKAFHAGDTSVRGDPEYSKKVMEAVQQLTNSGGKKFTPPPVYTPKDDGEAVDMNISAHPMASVDTLSISPKQAGWSAETDVLTMTTKLNKMFAGINAEHEQTARSGRAALESLLGDVTGVSA
jgi:membrane-bound lytic murein transglycosylase MltF